MLQKIVNKLRDIPTLPMVVTKIVEIVDSPDSSANDLNKVISMDQALTMKVLKLVNSAFYGFPKKIETLTQAIVILGFNTVRSLALSISMIDFFSPKGTRHCLNYPEFWKHSISTSSLAKLLAKKSFPALSEEAFVAGLIHDVGIIVLDQFLPIEFSQVLNEVNNKKIPFYDAEKFVIELTHCDVGRMLASKWNFPESLTAALAYHHDPVSNHAYFPLIAIIHAADAGAKILNYGIIGDEKYIRAIHISETVKKILKLEFDFPETLRETVEKNIKESEELFSLFG